MALHRKFALPVCVLRASRVIGLGLGLQHGRGGKLAAFVPGIAVVFVYYVIEYGGRQMAKGQLVPPWLAVWVPNIVLGLAGVALLLWRARSADKPHSALDSRAVAVLEAPRAGATRRRRRRGAAPGRAGAWSS